MRLLYGDFDLTIDDKNRLLIPSEIRKRLDPATDGDAFFLVTGVNGKVWLYPDLYYERLASQMRSELAPEEDVLAFDHAYIAMASRVEPDRQGRILIPEKVLRKAGLGREIVFVGSRDHAELWNRNDWQRRAAEMDERRTEVAVRARHKHMTTPG